jgi:hypothetical protein
MTSDKPEVKIDITPLIIAALPLARDLIELIIDAVQSAKGEDVTLEKIDSMLARVTQRNSEIQNLVADIRRKQQESG